MNHRYSKNRQGITLLFVISMIVLFLLMGTAFVVVSNNFYRQSRKTGLANVPEGKGPQQGTQLVEEAMMALIRGPALTNLDSPLRSHDLLADQYGYGLKAYVAGSPAPTFSQDNVFVEIALSSTVGGNADGQAYSILEGSGSPSQSLATFGGAYAGQVLSFTSKAMKGFSARIVSDRSVALTAAPSGYIHFVTIPAKAFSGETIVSLANLIDSEVIINGRDFNGTGPAFVTNGTTRVLSNEALLPNRQGQPFEELIGLSGTQNESFLSQSAVSGGTTTYAPNTLSTNEPWDAADFNNMFLSGFQANGTFIPSFHRQSMVDFNGIANGTDRKAFFFAFDEGGDDKPDVDVNGDGVNEAFWMDTGLSIATDSLGQRYKPLVAYHVVDLDGRLNLNAHGNLTHVRQTGSGFVQDGWVETSKPPAGATPLTTPRGQGWGPPEINLSPAFDSSTAANGLAVYNALMQERYGPDNLPGDPNVAAAALNPYRTRAELFGHPVAPVDLAANSFGTVGGLFNGSPMDLHGRFQIRSSSLSNFLDPNFGVAFANSLPELDMVSSHLTGNEISNPAYEMSLSGDASGDTPFEATELERLLRPNDIDSAGLPDRLWRLASATGVTVDPEMFWTNDSIANRNLLFTTDSFEVPMLHGNFVARIRNKIIEETGLAPRDNSGNLNDEQEIQRITDRYRLNATPSAPTNQYVFAPELTAGLKMDINRPFGNGNDDNGNGIVDEPGEEINRTNPEAAPVLGATPTMDLNNDTVLGNDSGIEARAIFARHLYMLAMLLLDVPEMNGDGNIDDIDKFIFARNMAQWAVNVVDFRDPDSINTQFIYDPQPWDLAGWNPVITTDGQPPEPDGSNLIAPELRPVVWGCERPELLITETLAGHIRNTQDLSVGGDFASGDDDFDQLRRPEPFAYFEVYNPWVQNNLNQRFDPTLYGPTIQGVDLQRVNSVGNPVWRFEVERVAAGQPAKPLRYVYLTDPNPDPANPNITYDNMVDHNQTAAEIEVFFPSTSNNVFVRPGHQAVIGTRGFDAGDGETYRTFLGSRRDMADPSNLDQTTHLALNAAAGTIQRFPVDTQVPGQTRNTSVVFIDQVVPALGGTPEDRKFSLSDPFGGYPATTTPTPNEDGFVYPGAIDLPFDNSSSTDTNRDNEDLAKILVTDGTSKNFRVVRLQRLANPLLTWHPFTNPYLTIDSMEADLVSFNGLSPNPMNAATPEPMVSLQPQSDNAVSHERGDNDGGFKLLWGLQRGSAPRAGADNVGPLAGTHNFDQQLFESLGKTNDAWSTPVNVAGTPFPWLTWNNRPFVSHMEIMNVPYLAQDRLTYAPEAAVIPNMFTIDDGVTISTSPFVERRGNSLSGRYGHLLNFFGDDELDANATNDFAEAHRLLEFIEVPSRFVGTTTQFLPNEVARHPFNKISRYRVPGKVNLNTIPPTDAAGNDSLIWNILNGGYATTVTDPVSWIQFKNSRNGPAPSTTPTDVQNPFRPSAAAAFMPASVPNNNGVACTMLRPTDAVDPRTAPLFDYDSTQLADNSLRSAYFRNSMRTRMANLTTNRSSVFAIWVTVGYFAVDQDGNLVDTNGVALNIATSADQPLTPAVDTVAEIGAETGEVRRNRGFFIFDRSIPVAFEPGKNHNIDKAIIVKSIIE